MGNISTYIQTTGEHSFDEIPFGEVDNLVLCYLSYYWFEGIVPRPADGTAITVREAARIYEEKVGESQTTVRTEILKNMAESERFSGLLLSRRVDVFIEGTTQFSVLCVELPDGSAFLAYRGVDNSLTGWKEAFQFCYEVTPAQKMAKEYLQRVAASLMKEIPEGKKRAILLAGHSKGGNLALYAAAQAPQEIRRMIRMIYLNDSPALADGSYDEAVMRELEGRIVRIVPHFSVLDSIYRSGAPDRVVAVVADGMNQHEPFLWQVEGNDFVTLPEIAPGAVPIRRLVELCLTRTSAEERRRFVRTLFYVMQRRHAAGKKTDFSNLGQLFLIVISTLRFSDAGTRRVVLRFVQAVFQVSWPAALDRNKSRYHVKGS